MESWCNYSYIDYSWLFDTQGRVIYYISKSLKHQLEFNFCSLYSLFKVSRLFLNQDNIFLLIFHLINFKWKYVSGIYCVISVAVETMNKIACSQLEKLEEKCPAITKPTDEVCLSVKQHYTGC